ncbi:hypothetical protein B0J17DRAFT_287016 [Rhizoctonia solani]|nr:hypothetical protein B0J17DRAFT_287016 [Rhizoctonia solani]
MEVMDSQMSEHFSAQAPTHIDVDMSAEYDDDAEYAMHDITEATTTTNDEEIYDAEFEEVPEHTEIEMDEYADEVEVVEDDETHMGTYAPTDDGATVTDVTVEDVQLLSSPVPAGIPQAATMHPISPHFSVDADLSINEVPVEALANHSPRSVATLVGDSEIEHSQVDTTKDGTLNEVIDLTENDEQPQVDAVEEVAVINLVDPDDQALPQSEHEVNQVDLDEAEQEFYEAEEPAAEHIAANPTAPDQLVEQQGEQNLGHIDQQEHPAEAPTSIEIPEQTDQDGHSPIEEALVINQQVRDDAADSMEPSPPIRLYYRDESKGTDDIFDIFTPTGLESHETVLLFSDNRTLFYEPLSAFFTKLRETEYFSGDEWDSIEMGLTMDLGHSSISINEDNKETDNISIFKLSSLWFGLGLEDPLEFTLVRRSERFMVQLTRLVEQVEHRDFHNEDVAEPPEVQRAVETGGPEINLGGNEVNNSDPIHLESDLPRDTHESKDTHADGAAQSEQPDEQRQGVDGSDVIETSQEDDVNTSLEEVSQDIPTPTQDPTTQLTHVDGQGTEAEATGPSPQDDDNTASPRQSPNTTPKPQGDDYDEYAGANDLALTPTSNQDGAPTEGWDARDYDYEEDYADDEEEHDERVLPDPTPNQPTDSGSAPSPLSTPLLQRQDALQNVGLKRNLDELEYEDYATPSAPSSPDNKRVKHV